MTQANNADANTHKAEAAYTAYKHEEKLQAIFLSN